MITFSKFKEAFLEAGKRILKVQQFGTKTATEVAPFGVDANPLKDMTAIFAETSNISESVIIGYINKNQLAKKGELRLYSLDDNNSVKSFIWLKNDGTLELDADNINVNAELLKLEANSIQLNGATFSNVRYEPLELGIVAKDALINAELVKIATVLNSLIPGSYVVSPVSTNIISAKSDNVKLG